VIHNHQFDVRPDERVTRRPTIDMPYREGLAFLFERKYTGPFTVHASEGVPKRIVVPNPEGW
jgi:hypothetical protein